MSLPDRRVRGGPPSHLYLLRDTLLDAGVDVRSFLYGGRVHTETVWQKAVARLLDLICLPWHIFRHRPDIVQLNSAFDRRGVLRDQFFAPLARLLGPKLVIKFHGSDLAFLENSSSYWKLATAAVIKNADVVCVLSREERDAIARRFPKARVEMVRNALELSRYAAPGDFRKQFQIPPHRKLLLFIARFIPTKGLREVILALPQIRQKHDVHAAFVGDGPVRAECESLCRELGLSDVTTFTGYIAEDSTIPAYAAADLLVFPTYHQEGMPMVIFHSMASGVPVVTTRIRAAADWLEENVHCRFVPPREPDVLARTVVELLDDPDTLTRMSAACRSLARRFDRTHVAAEFVELYKSLQQPEPTEAEPACG